MKSNVALQNSKKPIKRNISWYNWKSYRKGKRRVFHFQSLNIVFWVQETLEMCTKKEVKICRIIEHQEDHGFVNFVKPKVVVNIN